MRLGRYAWEIKPTEADRCCKFEDGLNDNNRLLMTAHGYTYFTQLVATALNVERVQNDEQTRRDRQHKRGFGLG